MSLPSFLKKFSRFEIVLGTLKSIKGPEHVLPALLAVLTWHPRYLPKIVWSDKSWTHNVFRFYEFIFGRRCGIRREETTFVQDGREYHYAHTFEALCALFETWVRGLWRLSLVKVWVPQLAPVGLPPMPLGPVPYLFAIALDAATFNSTFPTFAKTCTGTELTLVVGYFGNTAGGSITGYTYNSVSMTSINDRTVGTSGSQHVGLFYLIAPATGSNNVTRQGTDGSGNHAAVSYTGTNQSAQPDASATGVTDAGTTVTATLTTVADNSWAVAHVRGDADDGRSNNGGVVATARGGDTYFWDTDGALTPAGAKTVSYAGGGASQNWGVATASIAPSGGAAGAAVTIPTLLLLCVG